MSEPDPVTGLSFTVRYTAEQIRGVDAILSEIKATMPKATKSSRADVIRMLLDEAIDARRKEAAKCATPP